MEWLTEIAGWLGAAGILLAYFLNSLGVVEAGKSYQLLNLVGAAGVVWNSVYHAAWPSVGLNGIWAGIALVSLLAIYRRGAGPEKRQGAPRGQPRPQDSRGTAGWHRRRPCSSQHRGGWKRTHEEH